LNGRHREQAHSHILIWEYLKEIGRLTGRHRWQARLLQLIGVHPLPFTTQQAER